MKFTDEEMSRMDRQEQREKFADKMMVDNGESRCEYCDNPVWDYLDDGIPVCQRHYEKEGNQ